MDNKKAHKFLFKLNPDFSKRVPSTPISRSMEYRGDVGIFPSHYYTPKMNSSNSHIMLKQIGRYGMETI